MDLGEVLVWKTQRRVFSFYRRHSRDNRRWELQHRWKSEGRWRRQLVCHFDDGGISFYDPFCYAILGWMSWAVERLLRLGHNRWQRPQILPIPFLPGAISLKLEQQARCAYVLGCSRVEEKIRVGRDASFTSTTRATSWLRALFFFFPVLISILCTPLQKKYSYSIVISIFFG